MKITAFITRIQSAPLRIVLWTAWFPVVAAEFLALALLREVAGLLGRLFGLIVWTATMYAVGIVGINAKNEPTHLE